MIKSPIGRGIAGGAGLTRGAGFFLVGGGGVPQIRDPYDQITHKGIVGG